MKKLRLGKTDIKVTRIGFGGIPIQRVSEEDAVAMVQHTVQNGVDFIDTSRMYTTSEHRIGLALRQMDKKPVLATKSVNRTADGIFKDIETSLEELQVESIDIYQNHAVRDETDYQSILAPGGALEGMMKARDQGLIKHIGITSHSLDLLEKILDDDIFETIMVCYSFLEPAAIETVIPKARQKDVGIIAMKALSGGVIEKPEVAVKYSLAASDVLVLVGMEYPEYFDQIWRVFQGDWAISAKETKQIQAIQQEYDKQFCRRCDYCLPCTVDIPIQFVLGVRSITKRMGPQSLKGGMTGGMIEKAKECTECGECLPRCPYELPIPDLIKSSIQWVEEQMATQSSP